MDTVHRVVEQLLELAAYLHERELIHGALKSKNVMFYNNFEGVKVIEFGYVMNRKMGGLTEHNIILDEYAAPEAFALKLYQGTIPYIVELIYICYFYLR